MEENTPKMFDKDKCKKEISDHNSRAHYLEKKLNMYICIESEQSPTFAQAVINLHSILHDPLDIYDEKINQSTYFELHDQIHDELNAAYNALETILIQHIFSNPQKYKHLSSAIKDSVKKE
jgi:hypothetical protein